MNGYSRLGKEGNSPVSTMAQTPSPPSSPRFLHGRNKNSRGPKLQKFGEWLAYIVLSALLRRRGILLFPPLVYISGMLMYMGSLSLEIVPTVVVVDRPPPRGSTYRSPQVFEKLWPFMQPDGNHSSNAVHISPSMERFSELPRSNGFLIIEANGGLKSICDAVAVAELLNATLVIPMFHLNSVWRDSRAVRIAPFSNRLAHAVPSSIQSFRCLANYEALRFSEPIRALAGSMVDRMVKNSSMSGGKYISVHLRFEKVGMMLRGMGFDNTTSVYVAAGKIYKAEKYMAPLWQMFPLLETKNTIASPEELAPFKGHLSRLAAFDYTVCLHSEVFVTTQGGNFPHFLMGHRRYFYGGHAKTIKPDKRKLALLFHSPNIRWENFKRKMQEMLHHSYLKGSEVRKPSSSLYTFPMPDCMCKEIETENAESDNYLTWKIYTLQESKFVYTNKYVASIIPCN